MKVSFNGLGEQVATFEAVTDGDNPAAAGKIAVMNGNGKVGSTSRAGDLPVGLILDVRGGYATVQISGYMKMPCASSISAGYQHVVTDATGVLKLATTGRPCLVTDAENGVCGIIL